MSNLSFCLFTQPSLWWHLIVSHGLKNGGFLPTPSHALQRHEGFRLYGKHMEQVFLFPSKISMVEGPPRGSAQGLVTQDTAVTGALVVAAVMELSVSSGWPWCAPHHSRIPWHQLLPDEGHGQAEGEGKVVFQPIVGSPGDPCPAGASAWILAGHEIILAGHKSHENHPG